MEPYQSVEPSHGIAFHLGTQLVGVLSMQAYIDQLIHSDLQRCADDVLKNGRRIDEIARRILVDRSDGIPTRMLMAACMPLGGLLGGIVGELVGMRLALVCLMLGYVGVATFTALSPLNRTQRCKMHSSALEGIGNSEHRTVRRS